MVTDLGSDTAVLSLSCGRGYHHREKKVDERNRLRCVCVSRQLLDAGPLSTLGGAAQAQFLRGSYQIQW